MVESAEGVGELLEELKNNTFKKYDAFTVGEVFNMKPEDCLLYTSLLKSV